MLGAGAGGLATAAGVGIVAHFAGVAVIGVAATLLVARWLAPDPLDAAGPRGAGGAAAPVSPIAPAGGRQRVIYRLTLGGRLDALLLALGAITLCAALCEGAVADWSALFLRDVLDASDSAATTGFVVFSVVMAASRFGGGAVLRRWDPALVVAVGCLLAAGGTVLAVVAPVTAIAVIGFAAVGAGLACAIPVTFNAAGGHRLGSGPAISVVTTIGYTGFLAGPPLIGVLAQWAGLRVGLTAVAVFAAVGAALAVAHRDALRQHDPSRDPATAE
jgi:Na+/melibiose symporter-like transporter